ncbi:MAG: bifunctional precorrin-2 dehydrogenase/sirohydrochlorin ferrochelatase [Candidatus Coatesbacteria bacterium]
MKRRRPSVRFTTLAVDLSRVACLVVGGGTVATRKVRTLVAGGARVTVVSPAVAPWIAALARRGLIALRRRPYAGTDVLGQRIVVAATDDPALNDRVGRAADRSGALACVASSARHSRLIFPAVVRHGRVTVAVHTGGRSPALSRTVRNAISAGWGTRRRVPPGRVGRPA